MNGAYQQGSSGLGFSVSGRTTLNPKPQLNTMSWRACVLWAGEEESL